MGHSSHEATQKKSKWSKYAWDYTNVDVEEKGAIKKKSDNPRRETSRIPRILLDQNPVVAG